MRIPNGRFTSALASSLANARWSKPREESADDAYRRMLEDRRGFVLREGCTYKADRVLRYVVRYSVAGRVDQFDVFINGRLWKTGGARRVKDWTGMRV